jgi:hypothetical protein
MDGSKGAQGGACTHPQSCCLLDLAVQRALQGGDVVSDCVRSCPLHLHALSPELCALHPLLLALMNVCVDLRAEAEALNDSPKSISATVEDPSRIEV